MMSSDYEVEAKGWLAGLSRTVAEGIAKDGIPDNFKGLLESIQPDIEFARARVDALVPEEIEPFVNSVRMRTFLARISESLEYARADLATAVGQVGGIKAVTYKALNTQLGTVRLMIFNYMVTGQPRA